MLSTSYQPQTQRLALRGEATLAGSGWSACLAELDENLSRWHE